MANDKYNYFDRENCCSRTCSVKKRSKSTKWWGLQNLWWVPFSIQVAVDNRDEARLSTSWSTCHSFQRLAPHVQQFESKLVMMVRVVMENQDHDVTTRCRGWAVARPEKCCWIFSWSYGTTIKKTCVFLKGDTVILYTLYILCGDENLHKEFWCKKFHEPQEAPAFI